MIFKTRSLPSLSLYPRILQYTSLIIKGIYLSKALICMKFFVYKQELLFCQGDGYLWPRCCMNNLYISHRSLYAPSHSFRAIRSMLISLFIVTPWFDTVNNAVTRWELFAWTWPTIIRLQYLEVFLTQILCISGIIYNFPIWPWKIHKQKLKIYIFLPEICTFGANILLNIVVE